MAIKRITTNLIKDSDIATVDIANNAITAAKITDGNITTAKLADLSVTAGKLAGTLDLTGKTITVATATTGDNDTSPASTAFVQQEIAALVDSSPDSLNTLNELAAALGDDASFSTTVTNSIATKLPLAGGTLTGDLKMVNSSGATLDINSNLAGADSKILLHEGTSASPANGASIRYDGANNLFKIGVGSSVDTTRLTIARDTGNVGIGTDSPSDKLHIVHDSSTTNDTVDVVRIEATSSGTPAVGFGPVIDFRGERAGASSDSMGRVGFVADVMTASRIDGAFVVETAVDGTYTEHLRITSAGKVGIGQTPGDDFEVKTNNSMSFVSDTSNSISFGISGTNKPCIKFDTADTTHTNRVWAIENGAGGRLNFFRNGLDVLKLNQDGSVEIPGSITNSSAGATVATFEGNYSASGDVKLASFERNGGAVAAAIEYNDATTDMEFGTTTNHSFSLKVADTRRMTIMSNGGVEIGDGTNYGYVKVISNSAPAAYLDRRGSDGVLLQFRHDDSTDGQINTLSGRMAIGSSDTGIFFDSTRNCISPFDMTTNDGTNATIDIGRTGVRFNNAFLEKVTIEGTSNDEGIYFGSNHRIYGGSIRAFEASTTASGTVSLGEGFTSGKVRVSAPELEYPEDLRFKDDNGILRFTKTVAVGTSATTVLTITKSSYSYFIGGTITFILVDSGSPWGVRTQTYSISGRVATYQAGDNMGVAYSLIKETANMDYTPTLSTVDTRTTGQNGGTYEFKFANGSSNGSSNCKVIFDGYFAGGTLS